MTKKYNYKKKPNGKNDTGAPSWEPSAVQMKILEDSFKIGATVKEALSEAKIPSSTFYDYLNENAKFAEQIGWWQEYPKLIAKHSVVSHMVEDGRLALDYLKAKCRDEFAPRQELTGADGEKISPAIINVIGV